MHAITALQSDGGEITLERLANKLEMLGSRSQNADARHILLCLQKLAAYPQINLSAHNRMPAARIDMLRALQQGEVIYVFMEMDSEAPGLRPIAGLQINALVNAAKVFRKQSGEIPFVYVMVDEFYHIAGRSFGDDLSMGRGWGLHYFLANQTESQLVAHDKTLPDVVNSNTSVIQMYTLDGPQARDTLMRRSGEKMDFSRSYSLNPEGEWTQGFSESWGWHLRDDDINEINDTELASFLYVDSGRASPEGDRIKKVQGLYPIPLQLHQIYRVTPLPDGPRPEATEHADTNSTGRQPPREGRRSTAESRVTPPQKELQERMAQAWASIEAENSIE